MIVLLGLELVTRSFGLLPLPLLEQQVTPRTIIANWSWIFLGNLLGSIAYGGLLAIALTNMGTLAPSGVAAKLVQVAEAKTIGYAVSSLHSSKAFCAIGSSALAWSWA
jgi:formate transporter